MKIVLIVTCKGRLSHLQVTLPVWLKAAAPGFVLVDAGCPQGAGDWVERTFPTAKAGGDLSVVRTGESASAPFNKPRSANLGARRAIERGATSLLFVDADTLLRGAPPTVDWTEATRLTSRGHFFISDVDAQHQHVPGLTGVLGVSVEDFLSVGGFDETFDCWGGEDVDLRLRLVLRAHCSYRVWHDLKCTPLPHSNWLRTRYYGEKNLRRGAKNNLARISRWVQEQTGSPISRLSSETRRLALL